MAIIMRGATMYEAQFGRVWIAIRYRKYWRTSGFGFIRITDKDGNWPRKES